MVQEYTSECEFLLLSYHVQGKFHLVGWNKVFSPIVNWRLGFWRITTFNKALLGKWLWRYGVEQGQPWRGIIQAKYREQLGDWCTVIVTSWLKSVERNMS